MTGLIPGPDGWSLAPEGGLIRVDEGVGVVADVHLGYEWSRGLGGDVIPPHSLAETTARLARMLDRATVHRLIVAGDLVESPRPCRKTAADLRSLRDWLDARGVRLELVQGNHDPRRSPMPPDAVEVGGWTVAHGHRPIDAPRTISGHDHPMLRVGRTVARCILVGPDAIVLPAFSENAAGLNVAGAAIPSRWRGRSFRCWAGAGGGLLDFGPIDDLAGRIVGVSPNRSGGR